jgi:hypothetical protein
MKILSLSFCLVPLVLASASSLLVCSLHATPPPRQLFPKFETPGAEVRPVAYAKTIPLPSLIKKLQVLANEVQPENNQAQLLPVIVGAFIGDPTLSSVSPDHSSTVIFFDDFQEHNATILGVFKLNPNSPIPAQIKTQRLSVKEIEGWTMVTNKPGLLEQTRDWSSIIRFAEWQPPTTIEFGWLLKEFQQEISLQLNHGSLSKEMSQDLDSLTNLFLEELANLEAVKFSLSFLEKEIAFDLKVSARDGTQLDKLFSSLPPSQNLKGKNGVSQFVQSGGWMERVMNLNVPSHAAYLEHLLVKLEKGLKDKEVKQLVSSVLSMIRKSTTLYSGDSATSYRDLGDGDPLGYVQVGSTEASIADFKDLLAETNAFFQQFTLFNIETFSGAGSPDFEPSFVVKEAKPIDGTEVLSVKVNLEPETNGSKITLRVLSVNVGLEQETNGSKISSFSNQTVYYCVHEGKYIAATSRKALKQSLRAVKSGKPLKNNLSDKIILGPQYAAAWQLDLVGYGKLIGKVLKHSGIELSQWTQEIERVQEMKIPPISGKVGHGNGQYFLHTSIPLRTIKMTTELVSPAYIKKANHIREKSNAREVKQSIPTDEVKRKK